MTAAALHTLPATLVAGTSRKMPGRVYAAIALIVLGGVGLVAIVWVAVTHPRNMDGKLLDARARAGASDGCVPVSVRFDKGKVMVFTKERALKLRDDAELPPNSFKEMVLVKPSIDDASKVRVIEPAGRAFIDLDLTGDDKNCQ